MTMVSLAFSESVLKAKFRGCMIGGLVGDCLGSPFEFQYSEGVLLMYFFKRDIKLLLPSNDKLYDFMADILKKGSKKEQLHYTDDTEMTISVASSLAENGEINVRDMAEKFVTDFFNQTVISRGYGTHIRNVFSKLRESEYADIFLPAKEQFEGVGSYGNGAAMRIAPIALFGSYKGEEYIVNAAKECSLITHAHRNGYRGAILQCLAVYAALRLDPSQKFNPIDFINNLLEKMKEMEAEESKPYCKSLEIMKKIFLENREDVVTSEEIAGKLGNGQDTSALKSVPSAIFSFLKGMKPLNINDVLTLRSVSHAIYSFLRRKPTKKKFESSNPFVRTIYFAISLGGDTDTIAGMAGAIAGAYYGEDIIPKVVRKKCEAVEDVTSLADKLFDRTYKNK